jgi:hypothetical protein
VTGACPGTPPTHTTTTTRAHTPHNRAAYDAWQVHYADVAGPLLCRTLAAWRTIKAWLSRHCPRILASLNPGATAAELAEAEGVLGHPLPQAMRCIYRCVCVCVRACALVVACVFVVSAQRVFHTSCACTLVAWCSDAVARARSAHRTHCTARRVHNGQRLQLQQDSCEEGPPRDLLLGLFGCLAFYDHLTSNQVCAVCGCGRGREGGVKVTHTGACIIGVAGKRAHA